MHIKAAIGVKKCGVKAGFVCARIGLECIFQLYSVANQLRYVDIPALNLHAWICGANIINIPTGR